MVFLPRHGRGHRLLPSEVNYRANIYGMKQLGVQRIISVSRGEAQPLPKLPPVREDHRKLFEELTTLIRDSVHPPYTTPWIAAKLMEGDPEISAMMEGLTPAPVWGQVRSLLIAHEDALHAVVCGRYDWVEEITRACVPGDGKWS
jgi:hypothetical protein